MKRLWFRLFVISLSGLVAGCIGTDVLDWEVMPERLVISSMLEQLAVGDGYTFEAEYYDSLGRRMEVDYYWNSSNPLVLEVDSATGMAEGISEGTSWVYVQYETIADSLEITVGSETVENPTGRSAMMQGLGSYVVEGTATLRPAMDGGLELAFSRDFQSSNGPGLYIYLTNSNSSVTGGVSLGPLTQNSGAHAYAVPDEVSLQSYDFVLVYCQPFGVPFGYGEFAN